MKKIISIILVTLSLYTIVPFTSSSILADTYSYSLSGSGSEGNPYKIRNDNEWNTFTSEVNSDPLHGQGVYFKLTNDIGSNGNEVTSFVSGDFNGIFDGSNKSIWYNNAKSLFNTNNGEIINIVTRSSKELKMTYGAAVCTTNNGVIDHCANYVSILSSANAGGICRQNNGLIINCINYASIKSIDYFGKTAGICGNNNKQIINCINVGTVSYAGISSFSSPSSWTDTCFSYSNPLPEYGITCLDGRSETISGIFIHSCFYYSEYHNNYAIQATNNMQNNNWRITKGGDVIDIFEGIKFINSGMEDCNNQTDRQLVKWKLDGNGLPTYDELPSTGSIISSGNIWIIVIGIVAVIIGGTTIIINKKKNKVAHI